MPAYKYKTQQSNTGSINGSNNGQLYSLNISSSNANKITDYEIKVLVQDRTFSKDNIGYFRGEIINDSTVTPTSYSTNQDTSFIYNEDASKLIISNTITSIYDIATQTFNFNITNNSTSSIDYNFIISIELNFSI
jgi:hypothetical protein